jgi:hypothetical protein
METRTREDDVVGKFRIAEQIASNVILGRSAQSEKSATMQALGSYFQLEWVQLQFSSSGLHASAPSHSTTSLPMCL